MGCFKEGGISRPYISYGQILLEADAAQAGVLVPQNVFAGCKIVPSHIIFSEAESSGAKRRENVGAPTFKVNS